MSKLHVDQKTISDLFSKEKVGFLIPDYQRPYAWNEEECQTLWDDIFLFSFPNENHEEFNRDDEYFLGSIVTYKNNDEQSEVIDGQQRITTLLLILRAFYDKFANMQDPKSIKMRERIFKCIWKTDSFDIADTSELKIDSKVATDNDKDEFLELLRTGRVKKDSTSKYVENYQFFQKKIDQFILKYPNYCAYLPARLLDNCIFLPIEAESRNTALRIFSTLNNRGLPLSDADIFKSVLYQYHNQYNNIGRFIEKWKELEDITSKIFATNKGSPMDELFTQYMYFLRASLSNAASTTTKGLRTFYENNHYEHLKKSTTIDELEALSLFWQSVYNQDTNRFSDTILKRLFILRYAPNSMWQYITSVYFLKNRGKDDLLDDSNFVNFLNRITAFIFTYTIINPGVIALRTPIYSEMSNIIKGVNVTFNAYKFPKERTRSAMENYTFHNQRKITRSIITWYAYTFPKQSLVNEPLDIEHIYPKKRQKMEKGLRDESSLESLGNKILLERSINIKASDYRFEDKKKIYSGEMLRGRNKDASRIIEIGELINRETFDEQDIINRNKTILDTWFDFLHSEDLLKA